MVELIKKVNRKRVVYFENESGEIISKQCTRCNKIKEVKEFAKQEKSFCGIRSSCKECYNNDSRIWKENNKERIEKYKNENKEYYKKYRNNNKEKNKEYQKTYRENHEECFKESKKRYQHTRRARKQFLPHTITSCHLSKIRSYFNNRCALTGDNDFHMDHAIPLSSGYGGTIYENMIPLRADLNLSKNRYNLFEWFAQNKERFNLPQERFDNLLQYLAQINKMTAKEYRDYYYSCFEVTKEKL